jgi:nucleoside-diphosphate-sugar epimerase
VKQSNITKFEWLLIRPTSIWGPWFKAPYRDFFDRIRNRGYFKIAGKSSTKTFGFVYNAVHQIDKLLFSADKNLVEGKTFYIGDSPGLNINDWADEVSGQLNFKLRTIPLSVLKVAGWVGDILLLFNIKFPLQSFRVKNMTTDNIITLLSDTSRIVPDKPYSTEEGVRVTLEWMNSTEGRNRVE